jgi:predicted RNA-binding Zn-ribbon protein involved in translation (DUF1610 family)
MKIMAGKRMRCQLSDDGWIDSAKVIIPDPMSVELSCPQCGSSEICMHETRKLSTIINCLICRRRVEITNRNLYTKL